ncbi:MAG: SH3 domain-containing protein [Gammaproteobacteria bacterium]
MNSDIYIEPDRASTVMGNVPADAKVTILERKGTWYRIKQQSPANIQGWIWFNVQPESNLSWLERFRRVLKGGYSTRESTAVATIGIRGLGPGDIRKATPDTNELNKLDRYQSDTSRARRRAGEAGLRSQPVAYLIKPDTREPGTQGGYPR